jgi:hypothetical protein
MITLDFTIRLRWMSYHRLLEVSKEKSGEVLFYDSPAGDIFRAVGGEKADGKRYGLKIILEEIHEGTDKGALQPGEVSEQLEQHPLFQSGANHAPADQPPDRKGDRALIS